MDPLGPLKQTLSGMRERHLEELARLVRIPSVSAQGTGIREAAEATASLLEARGMAVQIHETAGNPVVTASCGAAEGPTLLFYEHYDVQPPDPLELWTAPPFDVTERDGRLYGRGTADTKGHLVCRLAAIDAVREVFGGDPVAYKFVVEGEEEVGSPNLASFLEEHAADLTADGCLWEFGGVDFDGRPVIWLGLKGIVCLELEAKVPDFDAHSSLGAVIDNPLYRIAAAIASLRDVDGRVTVDGFYDDVDKLSDSDLQVIAAAPDHTERIAATYGVQRLLGGSSGAQTARRLEAEPCLNVNGITGGYGGPGTKTVLPSRASAKLDIRLVPSQSPERVVTLVREHLARKGFSDVAVSADSGEQPGRTPVDDPFVQLVIGAARQAYGLEPVVALSSPGSGPAHPFREFLKVPFASAGCGYPGSRAHSPDEHIRVSDFESGKLHTALVIAALARPGRE